MILLHPYMLLFALVAFIPWFGPWKGPRATQNLLRSLVFVAISVAMAMPHLPSGQTTPCKVLIIDRSPSISQASRALALSQLAEFAQEPDSHLVTFGAPLQSAALSGFSSVTAIQDHPSRGTSPLSAAIARAQTLIPRGTGGSVTIASDSLATRPDDNRAIAALREQEIPVHWVQLETVPRTTTPVAVSWSTPLRKGANSRIDVRLVSTTTATSGTLILRAGETELTRANFSAAAEQTIQLSFEPDESGFVDAVVVAQNSDGSENALAAVLPIMRPHQLLYLGDRQTGGNEKLSDMLGPSFDVVTVDLSDTRGLRDALKRCDLVLLDDQPAENVSSRNEESIVDAVRDEGLGLVMSGGRASFGGGGWHDRPIETLLPIELVQKEEKRDPSTSLVIVIDTSGSMSGVRVQLAKEVSRLAMKRLLPHDKVGIVEFYGAKRWAAPLQPASNAIELQRALNRMDAGGGTVILPALEEAFYGLQNVDTRYKHVLVLTDGGVESGDFESLMRRMANEGINVSTVLAGGGYHSEFLVNIANWGKGRFYNVPNRFNLPEILLKQPSTTKLPSYRPGQHIVQARGGPGWWGEVDTSSLPPLAGYVESKPREGSEILLETVAEKHPILATWRYGLGRVTTLSTEPLGEGTEPWQKWSDYGNALARILQRSTGDIREPFEFEFEFDGGDVLIHAIRQQPRNLTAEKINPLARLHDSNTEIEFVRRSPDRYLARLPTPAIGETIKLETSATNTQDRWKIMSVMSPVMAEHFVDPDNAMDATTLVTLTGGQRMSPKSVWSNGSTSQPEGDTLIPLSPLLYGIALLLFLAEIIYRRLPRRTQAVAMQAPSIVLLFWLSLQAATVHAQEPLSNEVAVAATEVIDVGLRDGVSDTAVAQLFDRAILKEGNLQSTLDWLSESTGDLADPRNRIIAEIEVKLAARRGDLQRASDLLKDLLEQQQVLESRLDLVLIQAKFHDALGETDAAKELYTKLTVSELAEADRQTVSLRLALMGLLGDAQAKQGSDAQPLIDLATKSDDVGFKNRAANVLAVQNRHADALKLFTITGLGTQKFRSASRVTEWAIRAKERDKAIETAWQAVETAQLRRDRNYALALLVEAYRLKKQTAGIETLVDEFKRRNDAAEPMTVEMQRVWIDLLRELGRYDDAIALFRESASAASTFTVEMRRELLELEGEAGNTKRMISTYRELIETEPDELAWRGGLTQILLERGDNEQAKALWSDYVNETERSTVLMNAAQTLGELGLDLLAKNTVERMVKLRVNHGQALLYWADLQQRRGDVEGAEASLNRVQGFEDVGDDVRAELASAYERIGRQDKAIEVNEAIRATRKVVAEDLEMRLAWLYSEVGDEEKALDQWLALWRKITSIPRRRYVEDRLMTVASRLGTLADIAIEIEEKLADGTADSREAGLLVRIYSRVNDSVAATEISEEYMAQTGKDLVDQLQEKGRIYQICNDYWNYEKVIEELIEVDPEGETEYLRQLALSMLERGKAQDARNVLMNLRTADDGKDSIGGEFEAGVLSLVGMKDEAADAYRQAIATHPDRIESYLLLANLLKENNQTERAVGMFQYLAENAQRDDLFTIAIDGLLNMEAKGRNIQWARRITLERLAGREDKNYLYQLLSDLSAEVNDKSGQIRAMENSLAVSGTRRLSVLRECMELSSRIRGGVYYSSSSRGPSNKGNLPFFAFGRRLIGLNELMPPQVFLDLGKAFLDDGDTQSAERTFGMARNLADPRSYQREVAEIFEKAGKTPEALARYDRLLRTSPSDVPLMARVAKLNESEKKDAIAFRFYQGGLNLLLSQTPLTTREASNTGQQSFWSNNRDAYQTYSDELLMGMLVTVPEKELDAMVTDQRERLFADLKQITELRKDQKVANTLSEAPRVEKRFTQLQRIYLALAQMESLEAVDAVLLKQFPDDGALFANITTLRLNAGRRDSLARLMQSNLISATQQATIKTMLGETDVDVGNATLTPTQMWKALLPAWIKNDRELTLKLLRRLNQQSVRGRAGTPSYVVVNGRAVRQTRSNLGDARTWMQLAVTLGDDSLALQLARANCDRLTYQNQQSFYQMCREILPETRFSELVRYATNQQSQKPERLANYLWLLAEMKEYVSDLQPSDGDLLGLIQNGTLRLGYSFPFPVAMQVFPESIRADAFAETMESVTPKILPQELIRVPFNYDKPIDEATQKVVLAAFAEGIDAALQDNYLRYCSYYMPRTGTVIKLKENQTLAVKMLDLLTADKVQKREPNISKMAQLVKAMVLYQSGEKNEGIKLALKAGSPFETVSDSYLRMTRTWVYNQFLSGDDTQMFLDALPGKQNGKKLSVEDLDKRFALLQRVRATAALNMLYAQAAEMYPNESKYKRARSTSTAKPENVFKDITLQEKRIQELQRKNVKGPQNATQKSQDAIRSRLAALWNSVDHRVNAMKYWIVVDDHQRQASEAAKKQKNNADAAKSNQEAAERVVKPKTTPSQSNKATASSDETEKKYAKGLLGVKAALDAGDESGVLRTLRTVWRTLPPAVSSPYGSRVVVRPLSVSWPTSKAPKKPKNLPTIQKNGTRVTNSDSARLQKRGGLSTFVPPARVAATPRPKAWDVLAEHPYVLPEMHRIVRASFLAPANAQAVSLGLLNAERLANGDEVVLAGLVKKLQQGQLTAPVLDGFFEIVRERPELINDSNKWVLDNLMDQLGIKNGDQARLLAPLYARTGDLNTASALFRVSAFFPSKTGSGFARLIDEAQPFFQGADLLVLAEAMFETAYSRKMALPTVLELRRDTLPVAAAAEVTRKDFPSIRLIHDAYDVNTLIAGTSIYAGSGNHQAAIDFLYTLLKQHGKPLAPLTTSASQYYVNRGSKRPWLLTRTNLLDLFSVSSSASKQQKDTWWRAAATAVATLRDDETVSREIICEALLTIAYWQTQGEFTEAGKITLSMVDDELLQDAKKLEPLAVDLYREAGLIGRSFELQRRMQQEGNLSYTRFGEFVRVCAGREGADSGKKLFNELVKLSLDDALLSAGKEIAADDTEFLGTIEALEKEKKAAEQAYQKRAASAAARNTPKVSQASRTGASQVRATGKGVALPLSAPLKLRALPLKRVLKKP